MVDLLLYLKIMERQLYAQINFQDMIYFITLQVIVPM